MIDLSNPELAYTVGDWFVKPGAEEEFVREWKEFTEWLLEHRGAESFVLMNDATEPRHFVSCGAWAVGGSTVPWPAFLERLGNCRRLCLSSQSRGYSLASATGRASRRDQMDLVA
jgi:hypothetical protein